MDIDTLRQEQSATEWKADKLDKEYADLLLDIERRYSAALTLQRLYHPFADENALFAECRREVAAVHDRYGPALAGLRKRAEELAQQIKREETACRTTEKPRGWLSRMLGSAR